MEINMSKFYIDSSNNYIGGFSGNTGKVPAGAIEVPSAPSDARSKWDGTKWLDPVLTVPEKEVKIGVTDEAKLAAMWLFLADGDKTAIDDLKLKIASI